jgi:hypothetical protein
MTDTFLQLAPLRGQRNKRLDAVSVNTENGVTTVTGTLSTDPNAVEITSLVTILLALGGIVALLIMIGPIIAGLRSTTGDKTACPADGPCTVGVLNGVAPDQYCEQKNRPVNRACNNVCYVDGATSLLCNGKGACNGAVADCKGTCPEGTPTYVTGETATTCSALFPISRWYTSPGGLIPEYEFLFKTIPCVANQCVMFGFVTTALLSNTTTNVSPSPAQVKPTLLPTSGIPFTCADVIDQTVANTSCIVSRSVAVDAATITQAINSYSLAENGGTYPWNYLSWSGHVCVFNTVCGQYNHTGLDDPVIARRRSLSDVMPKLPEARALEHAINTFAESYAKKEMKRRTAWK